VHVHWFVPSFGDEGRLGDRSTFVPATIDHLVAVARAAEAAGFEGMLVPTGAGCLDGWVVASMLAMATERIRYMVAFRPGFVAPPVAARQAASLDRLSGGRLLLNVVTGGEAHEQRAYGDFLDKDARYARTDEFLHVVRSLWRGGESGRGHGRNPGSLPQTI